MHLMHHLKKCWVAWSLDRGLHTSYKVYFTFVWDKWVISGCETDIGDADLVELVRVPSSSVIIINSGIAEQWSSQTLIKL